MQGTKLPKGCKYIEIKCAELSRTLSAEVERVHGTISFLHKAAIDSAVRWHRHGMLAAYWLRTELASLSARDRLYYSEQMAKSGDARDKNIRMLRLDRDTQDDLLSSIYSRQSRPRLLPAPSKGEAS
jgi:hypothetical protein